MGLTVNQLMAKLRAEQKAGNGKLECRLFCHDQDPAKADEGDGPASAVSEEWNDAGEHFVAICT